MILKDELSFIDSLSIMLDITQYILGNNIDVNSIEFKQFREKLKHIFFKKCRQSRIIKIISLFFIKQLLLEQY